MGLSKAQRLAIEERRRQVAVRLLELVPKSKIAAELGCGRNTVTRDLKVLQIQWRRELMDDPVAIKARELAELEEMERHAALRQDQPEWWTRRLEAKRHRAKLLGLYDTPEVYVDQRMQTAIVVGDERDVKTILLERFTRIIDRRNLADGDPGGESIEG